MSKPASEIPGTAAPQAAPPPPATASAGKAPDGKAEKARPKESMRDTIESILFAFVLAFLFRTFEAEAFVIPTGSMAPTLYGRHKETECSQCRFPVVVGASQEVNPETGLLREQARIQAAVCTNCGFENRQIREELAFNGDRILVNKFPYEFGEPDRWDVFVFKYPQEPETNYIKRLVGLPGETIRIRNGDLFLVEGQAERILRKPPEKQRHLQLPVYDDAQPPRPLLAAGWPERWAGMKQDGQGRLGGWSDAPDAWQADGAARTYTLKEPTSDLAWLRYRHYQSLPGDWEKLERGQPLHPLPRLISDFCGYNAAIAKQFEARDWTAVDYGPFWTPDLTVNLELDIHSLGDDAELALELIEGTAHYRCQIDPRSGEATLREVDAQLNGRERELARAQTAVKGPGRYRISYANVDDRLLLWINDRLIEFGEGAELPSAGATGNSFPTQQDLTPVGIAARGMSATVSDLLLERDIYYRPLSPENHDGRVGNMNSRLSDRLTDPERWGDEYANLGPLTVRTIEVGPDHFLAFGDNSPQSNDSRLWRRDHSAVPREYLVGKAFWIYWPHGVPFLNDGRGFPLTYHRQDDGRKVDDYPRYTVPFYPQFRRMTRIR